jgi:8-oxo-dGTP pyrophosphatase MutT (NUDIX family)|tara:strand:- start:10 stop:453 length:444 start_codon:yes stop_codon:yes gene_type:complete
MQKKILSFICRDNKFLALRNSPYKEHGGDFWFVVTGGVNEGESYNEAVKREIKEETNLDIKETLNLNWGSVYNWGEDTCEELNFISFAEQEEISLNEEHVEFQWLDLNDFVKRIKWDDNKEILKKVLEKALDKKLYFKGLEIKDYRK